MRDGEPNAEGPTDARRAARNRGRRHRPRSCGRAQTTLDFAFGVSVFIIVTVLVLTFIPGALEPFTSSEQDDLVVSDRVVSHLSASMLVEQGEPYALNLTCTKAFFDTTLTDAGCKFSNDLAMETLLGVSSRDGLNVTLYNETTSGSPVACLNAVDDVVAASAPDCRTVLRRGESVPATERTVVSTRIVRLKGTNLEMTVRVW